MKTICCCGSSAPIRWTRSKSVVTPDDILAMQADVRQVRVEHPCGTTSSTSVVARATTTTSLLGASPRATMALYHTAQARAAIKGRDFVIPDDVKHIAPYVLTHRLVVNPQTRLRGREPEDIVRDVINTVPVPVGKPSRSTTFSHARKHRRSATGCTRQSA